MLTPVPDSVVLMVGVPFVKVSVNVQVTPAPCARLIVAVPPDELGTEVVLKLEPLPPAVVAQPRLVNCQFRGRFDSASAYVPANSGPVVWVFDGVPEGLPVSWKVGSITVVPCCTVKLKDVLFAGLVAGLVTLVVVMKLAAT